MRDTEDATRAIADMNGQVSLISTFSNPCLIPCRIFTAVAFALTTRLLLVLTTLLQVNT